jgi:Fe-S cluster assembly ATP-binding protein
MLTLNNLSVSIGNKQILHGISFHFETGKTYAIMGPNGSGKSTLASAVMGHPDFSIHPESSINMENDPLIGSAPHERAKKGLALSFQAPLALPGITLFDLMRVALEGKADPVDLHQKIDAYARELDINEELLKRSLNEGFSGGERKKFETLQIALLDPKVAIFDEIDTGVDVDALRTITAFLATHLSEKTTKIFITHSAKLLKAITPDEILVIKNGHLVATGGDELAHSIETSGFDRF